jgi:hypothetical protein
VLYQFNSEERARGHPRNVVRDLIRIFQTRRDAKIDEELADFRRQKQEKAEKRRLMRRTRGLQQARKRLERQSKALSLQQSRSAVITGSRRQGMTDRCRRREN